MSVTISIILDTRRMKRKNQKYPTKIRVIHKREPRDYQTIFDLTSEEFKKFSSPRIADELQEIRKKLNDLKRGAENFVEQSHPFEFHEFENDFVKENKLFRQREFKQFVPQVSPDEFDYSQYHLRFPVFQMEHPHRTSLSYGFLEYIKKLLQQGRIGNAINYLRAYRSLES